MLDSSPSRETAGSTFRSCGVAPCISDFPAHAGLRPSVASAAEGLFLPKARDPTTPEFTGNRLTTCLITSMISFVIGYFRVL